MPLVDFIGRSNVYTELMIVNAMVPVISDKNAPIPVVFR